MPESAADRNLLYGLLALQNHFVDQADLIAAFHEWTGNKRRSIGEILIGRGLLDAGEQAILDALTRKQMEDHGGDPRRTLASVGPAGPTVADLAGLADPDLNESLASVGATLGDGIYLGPTLTAPGKDGARAAGRFRILRPLARGGLGEVFVANDAELGREVALKQLQDHLADDPDSRSRFVREAEVTGGLEHPGVVPVYGLGHDSEGRPYYAMRLIQGESFKHAIGRFHGGEGAGDGPGERAVSLRKLLRHLLDVCDAIEYAHSRGVLHRDLKPSNVMIGKYGETLVVDWGLAKAVGRPEKGKATDERTLRPASASGSAVETLPGSALGTPQYMSPEQAAGQIDRIGPASDVYGLGAILYYLLAGRIPFDSEDVGQVLLRVQRGDFPPPRRVDPSVDPALEAICLKAMSLDPGQRYASPCRLADDIEHWLADEPTTAHRESWAHRLSRWSRRHRTWARAGAVTMALVLIVSVASALVIRSAWRRELAALIGEQGERNRADLQRDRALASLREASILSARLALDRGLTLADQNRAPEAVQWMARALYSAPRDAVDLDRVLRLNLDHWRSSISPIVGWMDHPDAVLAMALSPDGKVLLTGCGDGRARLWDAASGEPIGPPMEHQGPVLALAFDRGGKTILTGSQDGRTRFWDAATSRPIGPTIEPGGEVISVAFHPDGRSVATGSRDGRARLWDASNGEPIGPPMQHQGPVLALAFTPDGKTLLSGDDRAARAWDSSGGGPTRPPAPHPGDTLSVAFRPDGKAILTGRRDGFAILRDLATGATIGEPAYHQGYYVEVVAFGPDGRTVITVAFDNRARLWDAATFRPIGTPLPHSDLILAAAIGPDGRSVATGGRDRSARLWKIVSFGPIGPTIEHPGQILSAAYSPDGKALLTAGQDRTARLWDAATGEPIGKPLQHPDEVLSAAFSPDGKIILTGCQDGNARLWDAASGVVLGTPIAHSNIVRVVAFGPEEKTILTGSANGKAQIRDAATGEPIGKPMDHSHAIADAALSPDGRRVLTGSTRFAQLWDAASGDPIGPPIEHQGFVTCVAFSPDGRRIATGSRDRMARIRDAGTLRPIGPAMAHRTAVLTLAFSRDGRMIVTGDNESTARLWDAATALPIGRMPAVEASISAVAFRPDGRAIVSCAGSKARFWPIPTPMVGDAGRIAQSVQLMTGWELDPDDALAPLDGPAWHDRLRSLGPSGLPPSR